MSPSFWVGKRVFLTGHTGFKGGWLSLCLQQLGAHVTGYSLAPPTLPNFFDVSRVSEGMQSITGDIRDFEVLASALKLADPEVIIHMAAQPLVRQSYLDPLETYTTNVIGTVNLLEAAKKIKSLKALVNVTTDKVYENNEWSWPYRENESIGGADHYSSSKGCSELITAAYRASSFLNSEIGLATARAGNVIGGGDWANDRLVPDFFRAVGCGEVVEIRNPKATRPWQHVLEPLSGYLLLAERLWCDPQQFSGSWNFGPEQRDVRSVGWLVDQLIGLWEGAKGWKQSHDMHPHEATNLSLDISKARHLLRWEPRLGINEGLRLTVEWEKERIGGSDMRAVSDIQIQKFLGCAK